jgi:hypothetical protein
LRLLRFLLLENSNVHPDHVRADWLAGLPGRIAIARKHSDARRAADVVAVVTPAALAHLLETDEELLWLDSADGELIKNGMCPCGAAAEGQAAYHVRIAQMENAKRSIALISILA